MYRLNTNIDLKYYNKDRHFYICSYGGSGSWMLCRYLQHFGNVYHIHSRKPPVKLSKTISVRTADSVWSKIPLHDPDMSNHTVIYIYRNPLNVIASRLCRDHLKHIECIDVSIGLCDIIRTKKDLCGLEEFYDNYTDGRTEYPIWCIKYETFWDNIKEVNEALCIPCIEELYPVRVENPQHKPNDSIRPAYESLIGKMDKMPPIIRTGRYHCIQSI